MVRIIRVRQVLKKVEKHPLANYYVSMQITGSCEPLAFVRDSVTLITVDRTRIVTKTEHKTLSNR